MPLESSIFNIIVYEQVLSELYIQWLAGDKAEDAAKWRLVAYREQCNEQLSQLMQVPPGLGI